MAEFWYVSVNWITKDCDEEVPEKYKMLSINQNKVMSNIVHIRWNDYRLFFWMPSISSSEFSTQFVKAVQSACKPHRQPVEYRLKSHCSLMVFGRKQSHLLRLRGQIQGLSKSRFLTRWRPKVVPPVFWICKNTTTSRPIISKELFEISFWYDINSICKLLSELLRAGLISSLGNWWGNKGNRGKRKCWGAEQF